MKILGHKFFGQDSAVFYLCTESKEIFAVSSERISRIKKDNFDISPILDSFSNPKFSELDEVAYSFSKFDGNDAVLETKGTSYYWLNWQRMLRSITRPRYRSDLQQKKTRLEKVSVFVQCLKTPAIFYYKLAREYYWRKYLSDTLPIGFHFRKIDQYIRETLDRYHIRVKKISYFDHHTCHAVAAYYFSPFAYDEKSIVFTFDEHGDECFSKLFLFDGHGHEEIARSKTEKFWIGGQVFVSSIAGLYSTFTEAMDLTRSTDEGKVEALAAYGQKDAYIYRRLMSMVRIDGLEITLDIDLFKQFSDLSFLRGLRNQVGDQNFCATVQCWLEDVAVDYLNRVHEKYPNDNLCLAGGATTNVIMNHNIFERTPFKNLFILPPMGDEGSSVGAAVMSALSANEDLRWLKERQMPYFGPGYTAAEVRKAIDAFEGIESENLGDRWYLPAARSICDNKIIAIFHGRMEFGPRALGNRSILANAMDKTARDRINSTVKRRPAYQPFCPSVLEEERERLFENSFKHKHMATAFRMREAFRDVLASAIHVDGTARPQFVEEADNPTYYRLIKEVQKAMGYGIVINTSFNLHGRPIVNRPEDAITDFLDCNIDELYIEGYRVTRKRSAGGDPGKEEDIGKRLD